VSKYSADIEIAVRGGQQLDRTIKTLNRLNNSINVVTRNAKLLEGKGFNVASIENYSRAVAKAERAVRRAAEGTNQERQAITALVSAMELENKARERKNILIAREVANQRRVIATANAGVGIQGPALPAFMRTGPTSPVGGRRSIPGSPAALAAGASRPRATGGGGNRLGGAISGSIIGGAFPLLFGQGAGAAAGGAVGGLVGGLAGPGGSFAGSLLGTLLGDIASKGQAVKDLAEDMGLAAEGTKQLAAAFQAAGRDADTFGAAVQTIRGIGFADNQEIEAIKLVSKLTEDYGGKIDKVTAAYGNFVAKGKVGIADINKFTAQGIPILDELERSYGKNRDQVLALAKDGKITAQELSDALVRIANRSDEVTKRTKSSWEQVWDNIKKGASTSVSAFGVIIGSLVSVSANVTGNIARFFSQLYVDMVNGAVNAAARVADALASTANNIAAFYKANPLVIGPARDLAVQGLNQFKQGAKGTAAQLRALTKGSAGVGKVGAIQVPGQAPAGGSSGKSAADKAAEDAKQEAERVAEVVRSRQLSTLELQRQQVFTSAITAAEMSKDQVLTRQVQGNKELMQLGIQTVDALEKEKNSTAQLAIAREAQAKKALLLLGIELDIAKIKQEQKEQYDTIISDLDTELALKYAITEQERTQLRIAAEMKKLQQSSPFLTPDQLAIIQQGKERLATPKTGNELILERTGALEDELKVLTDYGTRANSIATGIGDAFANSFKGIVSGSMSAREALAGFFQSVADQFLDMAAQITAKWIQLTILNSILKLFPGAGGVGGGLGSVDANLAQYAPLPNAKGNTFGANGIIPFAKGGIVNGPTLFPFANGTGLMGEAGPEAIMPLQRGANGKLGVLASGGGGNVSVVVNVDASGSNVEGDAEDSKQLGRVIAAAIQQELVKQKRPGGLLA
jgi:lambda family phage tail tape measure protein